MAERSACTPGEIAHRRRMNLLTRRGYVDLLIRLLVILRCKYKKI